MTAGKDPSHGERSIQAVGNGHLSVLGERRVTAVVSGRPQETPRQEHQESDCCLGGCHEAEGHFAGCYEFVLRPNPAPKNSRAEGGSKPCLGIPAS